MFDRLIAVILALAVFIIGAMLMPEYTAGVIAIIFGLVFYFRGPRLT
jgi:predicted anti-sigma-YlaC factor YlaD